VAASVIEELADTLCPPGSIMAFAGPTNKTPAGWLLCDGKAVSSTAYPRLYAAIEKAWGDGSFDSNDVAENPPDPATDFNLPDLRGLFLRGASLNSTSALTKDPDAASRTSLRPGGKSGNAVGSFQADHFKSHNHGNTNFDRLVTQWPDGKNSSRYIDATPGQFDNINSAEILPAGGNETRPKNAYVNYIIKY
jgi:microcystin-dependent protein